MPSGEFSDQSADIWDSAKAEKKKKKKKRKGKHRSPSEQYDVPGVVHLILNEITQTTLGIIVGETVTVENPWKRVKKYLIQELLDFEEVNPDVLPFVPYKQEIAEYPGEEMLIGYIPNETRDYDEFYFCLTMDAENHVIETITKIEAEQKARLNNTINKVIREWNSLGSEIEVTENIPQRSRGLYRVEYETSYPIMPSEVKFEFRMVQEARDGYIELKVSSRQTINIINRKRIDTDTQIAPGIRDQEAQTTFTYPRNAWTQYKYECEYINKTTKEFLEKFNSYFRNKYDALSDNLYVNYYINFYENDYSTLDPLQEKNAELFKLQKSTEYISFKDSSRSKDKMITAVKFHPMWTGIVAIAYGNDSPLWYKKTRHASEDFASETVHGYNPVLIWSFNDGLVPKLILETTSEVHSLSFCPHNENILIGGCKNGQVVLWDIKNKITKVEEEEILTTAQQNYRILMLSYMKWMKNTKDLSIVPPTATSELLYSDINTVTSISWIHPRYTLTKLGHLEPIENEEESNSLQFMTSCVDGNIKFWDLNQIPVIVPGDYKPQRKLRRLKRKPSALVEDVSPFRILNRKLRPHYQINVVLPKQQTTLTVPLSFASLSPFILKYLETSKKTSKARSFKISERRFFTPSIGKKDAKEFTNEFVCGTYFGELAFGNWEGFEYLSGNVVSVELSKIFNVGKYHDGPITTIDRHPVHKDLYLTIGGKVFAIWKTDLNGRPLLWRKNKNRYTHGYWRQIKKRGILLCRSDGVYEIWNFLRRSDKNTFQMTYSGKALLHTVMHPFVLEKNVFGIADDLGTFRLMFIPGTPDSDEISENKALKDILYHCAERKANFQEWQQSWTEQHASWILQKQEEAILELERKKEEEKENKLREEEQKALEAEAAIKKNASLLRPPPGRYDEWAHEQWIEKEQERMTNVLLAKKRLDKETLFKQQIPLKRLEYEAEKKHQKQKQRLQRANVIFNETIAMLFPDLVDENVKTTTTDTYTNEELIKIREQYFNAYKEMENEIKEYINSNEFVYRFSWKDILKTSIEKKHRLTQESNVNHKMRREAEKRNRVVSNTNIVSSKILTQKASLDDDKDDNVDENYDFNSEDIEDIISK